MDDFEMEELDHFSELYDEIDRLRAKTEELSKALDAMTAERDDMERKKNLNWLDAVRAKAGRDSARAVLDVIGSAGFIRPIVEEQSCGEWGDDIVDEDTRKIVAAIRAMIEQAPQVPKAPTGQGDKG